MEDTVLTGVLYYDKVLSMNWDSKKTDELCVAFLSLRSKREMKNFLRDLMTKEEIIECAKRWETAQLLDEKMSYEKIQKKTGLSSTTVARISLWLQTGMGGYRLALNRLHHTHPS